MKILYVEDNAVNLSLIQRIAKMNSHDLVSFDEAETALAWMEKTENKVDLILLDIQLAGEMDGIGFAKTLRARGAKHPIIAITAYAMMGDKERILSAGCNEYLPKPLPIAEFLTLLAKYDPALQAEKEAAPVEAPKPLVEDAVTKAIESAKDTTPKPPSELKAYLESHPKTEPRPTVEIIPSTEPKPTSEDTLPMEVKPTLPMENSIKTDNGAKAETTTPEAVPVVAKLEENNGNHSPTH